MATESDLAATVGTWVSPGGSRDRWAVERSGFVQPVSPDDEYAAFLSYRHGDDAVLAEAVQVGLQRLGRRWNQRRALRVFRDATNLSADPRLWASIEQALARSRFLVLLASPASAASPWVQREVGWWLEHKGAERILLVLTDGTLPWEPIPEAGEQQPSALPDALLAALVEEPRWVDLRWARSGPVPQLDDPRFHDGIADLAAPLHGRPKDDLVGADVREHRRTRRVVRGAVAVLTALTVLVAAAVAVALTNRAEARRQHDLTLARQLAGEATEAVGGARPDLGALLAAQAMATADVPEARAAMVAALRGRPRLLSVLAPVDDTDLTSPADPHVWLATRPDGRLVVAAAGQEGMGGQRLVGWELPGGGQVYESDSLGVDVTAMVFAPEGGRLAVALGAELAVFRPGSTEVAPDDWDVAMPDGDIAPTALAFSPDGRVLAAGGADCSVTFRDAATGQRLGTWSSQTPSPAGGLDKVLAVSFSPDGRRVARVCESGVSAAHRLDAVRAGLAFVDDSDPGEIVFDLGYDDGGILDKVAAISPDMSTIAMGDADGLRLWSIARHREVPVEEQPTGDVHSLAFSADSRVLAAGADDVRLWRQVDNGPSWAGAGVAPGLGDGGRGVALVGDGGRLVTAGALGSFAVWDTQPAQDVGGPHLDHFGTTLAAVSGDGRTAVTVAGSTMKVWAVPSGQARSETDLVSRPSVLTLDQTGRTAVISGDEGLVVWRLGPGAPTQQRTLDVSLGVAGGRHAADLAPDGGTVAVAGADGHVRLVDTGTGDVRKDWPGEADRPFETVAFAPAGDIVAAAASGRVSVWRTSGAQEVVLDNTRDDEELDELLLQTTPERDLSFSADGKRLAVRERGGVRVWDVASGEAVGRRLNVGDLSSVALSSDGRMLVGTVDDGLRRAGTSGVMLWDAQSKLAISDPLSGKGYDSSPDLVDVGGGTVVAVDSDGAFVWTTDTAAWTTAACRTAGRALSRDEWERYVAPDEPYRPACAE
jgi:WD40 repeat protein